MSLNLLRENLTNAAHEYVQAHTEEMSQKTVEGVQAPHELTQALDTLLQDALYDGALSALMNAKIIRGNQSKAAQVLGLNRATVRKKLYRSGLLVQRRQRSKAEQEAFKKRGSKPCEATRKGKLPGKQVA